MSLEQKAEPNLRKDVRAILSEVPATCDEARLYPAGLNYCECYLLAQAIKGSFEPDAVFKVAIKRARHSVQAKEIDVDFIFRLCLNDEGGGAQLRDLGSSLFFALDSEDTFALLAGESSFLQRAIPFPDDIWAAYFEQIMKANEPDAYELILEEFGLWKKNRSVTAR